MPQELTIKSLADIEPALARLLDEPDIIFVPDISPDLIFTIKLAGRTWDGLVDARVAGYVTELQRTFDRARRETAIDGTERLWVKVRVKDGSTDLVAPAFDLFRDLIGNMNEPHKFALALVVIGCAFGLLTLRQVLAFLKSRQDRQLTHTANAAAVEELGQNLRLALEKIDPEKPVRTLVKGMQGADTITLPVDAAPLSRDEARQRYPRKPRVTPIDVIVDDNYHVASVALERPAKLTLESGDISFRAEFSLKLGTDDQDAFIAKVKAALETGTSMRVALQIDARVNDHIMSAVIVGIGKTPREKAVDLHELLD